MVSYIPWGFDDEPLRKLLVKCVALLDMSQPVPCEYLLDAVRFEPPLAAHKCCPPSHRCASIAEDKISIVAAVAALLQLQQIDHKSFRTE